MCKGLAGKMKIRIRERRGMKNSGGGTGQTRLEMQAQGLTRAGEF
jgi:hypothetical protein